MKRILYLDKNFIESYIAQARGGLEGHRTYATTSGTVEDQDLASPSINHHVVGEGNIGFGVVGGNVNYQRDYISEGRRSEHADIEGAMEAVTLMMHDNALEEVIHLSGADIKKGWDIGDFIIVTGSSPLVYDIRSILQRMNNEAVDFIARKQWEEYLKRMKVPAAKQVHNGEKAYIAEQNRKLNESKKSLEMACLFAQFDICIVVGDTIAPMKRDCMRTSSNDMIFKYADRLYIFGQVTRSSLQNQNEQSTNPIKQLHSIFNGMWPDTLVNLDILPPGGYKVLDPMAIYFE